MQAGAAVARFLLGRIHGSAGRARRGQHHNNDDNDDDDDYDDNDDVNDDDDYNDDTNKHKHKNKGQRWQQRDSAIAAESGRHSENL